MNWRTKARSVQPKQSKAYCRIVIRDADDVRESVVVEIDGRAMEVFVANEVEIIDERVRCKQTTIFEDSPASGGIDDYVSKCGDVLEERLVGNSEG